MHTNITLSFRLTSLTLVVYFNKLLSVSVCLNNPHDDSDTSKSHPERGLVSNTSVVPAILDQEPPWGSWEGLREGSLYPLAGGRDKSPLGDTETGSSGRSCCTPVQWPETRPVSSGRWGALPWVGISPDRQCSTMFRTLIQSNSIQTNLPGPRCVGWGLQ